ncbi:MAG TPA: PhoU domain-containing protein [Gemmatimonadaceae bacterium]
MSHYQERLDVDLREIRSEVDAAATLAQEQVGDAVRALLTFDLELATQVILKDRVINRITRHLDRLCHGFIVRHLPVGHDLRYISAVQRVGVALERIGDYAATVSRHTIRGSGPPPDLIARDFELLSHQARVCLAEALHAFREENADMARRTLGLTYNMDSTHDKASEDLIATGERHKVPVRDLFGYAKALYVLLRVSDQAENVAQETLFAVTGETHNPKVYRILFVDRANDCKSLLAEAYARQAFPDCGAFSSAGWEPADAMRPEAVAFLEGHGLPLEGIHPKRLPELMAEPRHFHLIIGLDRESREKVGELPYKTIFLNWDVGPCPFSDEGSERADVLYREIASRMRELMLILRGVDAA